MNNFANKFSQYLGKFPLKRKRWTLTYKRAMALKKEKENYTYNTKPRITAIIQCFNCSKTLPKLLKRLLIPEIDEIIGIDDGSADNTLEVLKETLREPNHFVIHSNDIFEIRTYNRALRMALGNLVVLLQDDDLPPNNSNWIEEAYNLFIQNPKLAILGGRDGLELLKPDPPPKEGQAEYKIEKDIGGIPGVQKYRIISSTLLGKGEFKKTMTVNRAPMWIRRSVLPHIGYLDERLAPFQCDDVDVCIRAWLAGWHVGIYAASFERLSTSGMKIFNPERVDQQSRKNWLEIYNRYGEKIRNGELKALLKEK